MRLIQCILWWSVTSVTASQQNQHDSRALPLTLLNQQWNGVQHRAKHFFAVHMYRYTAEHRIALCRSYVTRGSARNCRMPLNAWSAFRWGRYLQNIKCKKEISMPTVGLEHAIQAIKRMQTQASDRATSGISLLKEFVGPYSTVYFDRCVTQYLQLASHSARKMNDCTLISTGFNNCPKSRTILWWLCKGCSVAKEVMVYGQAVRMIVMPATFTYGVIRRAKFIENPYGQRGHMRMHKLRPSSR
jgi:hypothetical protein